MDKNDTIIKNKFNNFINELIENKYKVIDYNHFIPQTVNEVYNIDLKLLKKIYV